MNRILQIAAAATAVALPFYVADMRRAYKRLESYGASSFMSQFGKMAFVDKGSGEAILISHGIFGGYDQGMVSLDGMIGDECRKIALSRFGYPGSELPPRATPQNQATVFAELLDQLDIEKAFVLATSAGGAAALSFALNYPDRIKGLILVSSGVPSEKQATGKPQPTGPPAALLNEFPLWLSIKLMRPIFGKMFGSSIDEDFLKTMLPIKPRRAGIETDANLTNVDMDLNYAQYPVETISAPILILHAKDDPVAKFGSIQQFIARTHPETVIFETGGHLLSGHETEGAGAIEAFIKKHA